MVWVVVDNGITGACVFVALLVRASVSPGRSKGDELLHRRHKNQNKNKNKCFRRMILSSDNLNTGVHQAGPEEWGAQYISEHRNLDGRLNKHMSRGEITSCESRLHVVCVLLGMGICDYTLKYIDIL